MRRLEPCPFCGKDYQFVERSTCGTPENCHSGYAVHCDNCLARGPLAGVEAHTDDTASADNAERAWNRRPPEPPGAEVAVLHLLQRLRVQGGEEEDGTPEPNCDKMPNRLRYGDRVRIVWRDDFSDTGFIMGLPTRFFDSRDPYMSGVVFIPWPDNPGGKDVPEPEWVTLMDLALNPLVVRVEVETEGRL